MRKSQIKDIATAMIYAAAQSIDGCAFEDIDMSEKDIQDIIDSITEQCYKGLAKLEHKYGTKLDSSCTSGVVNNILKTN